MDAGRFLTQCLRFDLETNESGEIYALGARWADRELSFSGHFDLRDALRQLDQAASETSLLLGHNLLHHDLEVLRAIAPELALLQQPVVDTLYLSPLAFPENPYHRLVKDYKLLRDARNQPLADVRLSEKLLHDQWHSFTPLADSDPLLLSFYHHCCQAPPHQGLASFFTALGAHTESTDQLADWLGDTLKDRVCGNAIGPQLLRPLQQQTAPIHWAYAVAWLRVAGANSVLPPWVRLQFPAIIALLQALRELPCNDPQCGYCRRHHDPTAQLENWFGFQSFRAEPANASGGSLQQDIVSHAMSARPLFAILPTGGGKSLCFQLPALARHQRLGVLTIVISPLQALMKDQVDNLCQRTGGNLAAALYGLLSPPERSAVLSAIRMGDLALLYVSPEQLRNPGFQRAIAQREIGCWVFDEAHCLSKWGHDFRPDYLYAARFIKEFAATRKTAPPPVQCFTATAKQSVIDEVRGYFKENLQQELTLFEGGVERDNLQFEVQSVNSAEKLPRLQAILEQRLPPDQGSAVIYRSSRKCAEEAAEYLNQQGLSAAHFHAGMDAGHKRSVQEDFIGGQVRIICATNAFGMGIDKDDVRLVIHLEVPGSLENYLQEAGRAGRDRGDAQCILLYDEQDIEAQFKLGAQSRLSQRDIIEILRSLRRMQRDEHGEVVVTSAELLRDEQLDIDFDAADRQADTKVRSAVSWLERAGLLERNQNRTQVFQGRPLVRDLQQASDRIVQLDLSKRQRRRWLSIIESLLQANPDQGFSADELAETGAFQQADGDRQRESDSQRVLRTLHDMANAGLIQKSTQLSALLRHQVSDLPENRLLRVCTLENALIRLLREQAPDAADDPGWQQLSLRRLNQHLLDQQLQTDPDALRKLLFSLAHDGQGLAGQRGSISVRQQGRDHLRLRLQRDWTALQATAERRQAVAAAVLRAIQARAPKDAGASAQLLVEFALEDLLQELQHDALLSAELKDPLAAAERALLFLHEQKVIHLQKGLAVFRQAMTIHIPAEAGRRRYTKGDYAPLAYHYGERVFQVHVINEYARLGLERISDALALVLAYFSDSKQHFIKSHFPDRTEDLQRALSEQAYKRITDGLSPVQAAVVAGTENRNQLVLAGPGSGKTRLIVHRCAWLLQVQRLPPRAVLMLSFNRSAALELRRRLAELVGDSARGVTILTYHGLALRLTGQSLAAAAEDGREPPDLDACVQQATALLEQQPPTTGSADSDGEDLREQLLRGYRHILVDEYQDINADQYQLISAIAGRRLKDPDARLSILAVGDDDQNIYSFRDTSVAFIHRFRDDYQAQTHQLLENYRSSANIIASANQLIRHNRDRMKIDCEIRIDQRRQTDPPGGQWQRRDPLARGRVQCLMVTDPHQQAHAIVQQLQRLRQLQDQLQWRDCAILARGWAQLQPIRSLCQAIGIPVSVSADQKKLPNRSRIREYARFLQALREAGDQPLRVDQLQQRVTELAGPQIDNRWWREIQAHLEDWRSECADTPQPPSGLRDYLYETLAELRHQGHSGEGVLLSTAHSAKGLEFDHLFILDGGWSHHPIEEERRLYYVAMTRARDTLCLCELGNTPNPHTPLLRRELPASTLLTRHHDTAAGTGAGPDSGQSPTSANDPALTRDRYQTLGPAELYLDFAAEHPANHPIHRHIAALQPGCLLTLATRGDKLRLLDSDGLAVGQLAKGDDSNRWLARLADIREIRVIAIMQRRIDDVKDEQYRRRAQVSEWELPVVEIVWA